MCVKRTFPAVFKKAPRSEMGLKVQGHVDETKNMRKEINKERKRKRTMDVGK